MSRSAKSYPCPFLGCAYTGETKKFAQAHIVKEHWQTIERRRRKLVLKFLKRGTRAERQR